MLKVPLNLLRLCFNKVYKTYGRVKNYKRTSPGSFYLLLITGDFMFVLVFYKLISYMNASKIKLATIQRYNVLHFPSIFRF